MAKSLRKYAWKKKTTAAIGIGTLIVFIALVLTAAIASAVILRTAYSLKDKAENAGTNAVADVSGGIKVLDITGDRGNPITANIVQVKFMLTVWAADSNGVDIAKLRVHWKGPTKEVVLNLRPASWNTASSTEFGAEEEPIKTPTRSPDWDPGAIPPTFFLINGNIIHLVIDLTALSGINDPLGPDDRASVYFEPAIGLVVEETFTTPNSYGLGEFIDLTMQ
jgi:flagellin FlaB